MGSLDIESIHQTSTQLFENHVKEKENMQKQFEDAEWVRLITNAFWFFIPAIINLLATSDLQCKLVDWFLYDGEHWTLMG